MLEIKMIQKLNKNVLYLNYIPMTNSFLPADYKSPSTEGGYMKFKAGQNKFRVLGSALIGWEYFNQDNKPQRFAFDQKPTAPKDIKADGKVKHFRAFPVYNYQTNSIELLELTQSSIMGTIKEYIDNPKWGNPTAYDIIVGRTGEGLETEYTVTVDPKEEITKDIKEAYEGMNIYMEALFVGENPFTTVAPEPDNLPF